MSSALDHAVALAAKGFHLFPVEPGGKRPVPGFSWTRDSTSSPDQLRTYAAQYPGCNFGVDCGRSNVAVLDVDCKPGQPGLQSLDLLPDIPATFQVETWSGGLHFYFAGLRRSGNRVLPGIDIKSRGGYVVAPGSVIDGKPYRITRDLALSELPGFIRDLGSQADTPPAETREASIDLDGPASIAAAVEYLKTATPSVEGDGGDENAYRVACKARDHGLSEPLALQLMLSLWNDRCTPPWEAWELEQKVRNAYAYARGQAGAQSPEAAFSPVPAAQSSGFTLTHMPDVDIPGLPKRQWVLGTRYMAGFITVTVAPGGTGKSAQTMLEAAAVASGKALTGEEVHRRGAVWVFNTEDPLDEIERRFAAIGQHHKVSLRNVFVTSGHSNPLVLVAPDASGRVVVNDAAVAQLIASIKEHKIVLIVADPFIRTHRVNENDNAAIDRVVQVWTHIAASTGAAVSLVHHTRKKNGAQGAGDADSARGASSLISAARIAHTLANMSEDEAKKYSNVGDHRLYVRLDNAKGNMSAPTEKTVWFRKLGVDLPNGDRVGVLEKVELDAQATVTENDEIAALLRLIAAMIPAGESMALPRFIEQALKAPSYGAFLAGTPEQNHDTTEKRIKRRLAGGCSFGGVLYTLETRAVGNGKLKHIVATGE